MLDFSVKWADSIEKLQLQQAALEAGKEPKHLDFSDYFCDEDHDHDIDNYYDPSTLVCKLASSSESDSDN